MLLDYSFLNIEDIKKNYVQYIMEELDIRHFLQSIISYVQRSTLYILMDSLFPSLYFPLKSQEILETIKDPPTLR